MGENYAEGVILDLEKTWEESDPRTPLICFLSMGSDPTDSIIALGKRQKIETRYVSMGQGQEVHARKLLQHNMANVSRCFEVTMVTSAVFLILVSPAVGRDWLMVVFSSQGPASNGMTIFRDWLNLN